MRIRGVHLLTVLLVTACAPTQSRLSKVRLGSTTPAELQAQVGTPTAEQPAIDRPQARILSYPGDVSFQVEADRVVARFEPPKGAEGTLQYWRHRFAGTAPSYTMIEGSQDPHGRAQFLLKSEKSGRAVIFSQVENKVVRVIEYARPE